MHFLVDIFDPVEEAHDKDHQPVLLAHYEIDAEGNGEASAKGVERFRQENPDRASKIIRAQATPLE